MAEHSLEKIALEETKNVSSRITTGIHYLEIMSVENFIYRNSGTSLNSGISSKDGVTPYANREFEIIFKCVRTLQGNACEEAQGKFRLSCPTGAYWEKQAKRLKDFFYVKSKDQASFDALVKNVQKMTIDDTVTFDNSIKLLPILQGYIGQVGVFKIVKQKDSPTYCCLEPYGSFCLPVWKEMTMKYDPLKEATTEYVPKNTESDNYGKKQDIKPAENTAASEDNNDDLPF